MGFGNNVSHMRLENFLDVFAKGGYEKVKKRKKETLSTLASNLDGTCAFDFIFDDTT